MDFVTHSLIGVGAMRMLTARGASRAPLALAAVLGSMLMDGDSWLYLIGPEYYGRYHRVASHSIAGLALCGLAAAAITYGLTSVKKWRSFGWFVEGNLCEPADRPTYGACALVALTAAYLHFFADMITGFGNVLPFWPWSWWDASLSLVNSFDVVIFSSTVAWHLLIRHLDWPRRREKWVTIGYVLLVLSYLVVRGGMGARGIW